MKDPLLKVFKLPQSQGGRRYVIGVVPTEGFGGKAPESVACVLAFPDRDKPGSIEQVAILASNEIDPITLGSHACQMGKMFNNALVCPEINKFDATLFQLRLMEYGNIYRGKPSGYFGWWTTAATKPRLDEHYHRLRDHVLLNDDRTERELLHPANTSRNTSRAKALKIALYCGLEWQEPISEVA